MGQFLPRIKNVFEEIETCRRQLERGVDLEVDSNIKDTDSKSYQPGKKYSAEK